MSAGVCEMREVMRVAIVEDCEQDRELLKKNLERYERERGDDLRFALSEFGDGEDLVTGYSADYDLILMDIKMTFMNGMRAARRIRELDPDVVIVFITSMPQYAIEGYKVRATDYVLKPISWFSFRETMTRALSCVKPRESGVITIAMRGGRTKLETSRICYVEAQDHQLIYNTRDGAFATKGTMSEAEAQLRPANFFRCSRCYLVNLMHIDSYQGCDIRVNGDTIQISRRRHKAFLDALNAYMNGDGQ